ncbi:cold-shock protein [Erwinia sp. E_sp_B01_9]|uniref:cold shock small protein YmcF n=1 Tax=unclassified Erwinia TaxID=2622719 RepID=UPI003D9B8AB0
MLTKVTIPIIKFKCPSCHGCQFRFSPHNITPKNPHGANCIFCKAGMTVSYRLFAS